MEQLFQTKLNIEHLMIDWQKASPGNVYVLGNGYVIDHETDIISFASICFKITTFHFM